MNDIPDISHPSREGSLRAFAPWRPLRNQPCWASAPLGWSPGSGSREADCDKRESRDRLERALIAEIESASAGNHSRCSAHVTREKSLGGIDKEQLRKLEEVWKMLFGAACKQELRPIYATLPREHGGGLGYAAARYLPGTPTWPQVMVHEVKRTINAFVGALWGQSMLKLIM